jgi:transcriptional regulator with XRE-family HTH domain
MKCHECGTEMIERKTTFDKPYPYTLSGLNHVYLLGISLMWCATCESESPVIPRVAELHRVISEVLVRKDGLLSGEELRFLRKNAGFQANQFAALLGLTPEHLCRVEKGPTENLGEAADRLARAICMTQIDRENQEAVRNILLKREEHLKARQSWQLEKRFKLSNGGWKEAA